MAKLDQFGRPIYETAEEYNKAKRAGSVTHTEISTDSSNQKTTNENSLKKTTKHRQSKVKYSLKSKLPFIGIAICFLVLGGIIVFLEILEHPPKPDYTENQNLQRVEYPLPEGFETFLFNGQTYTLPTTYDEISKMGFVVKEYGIDEMVPSQYTSTLDLVDEKGIKRGKISVNNSSDLEIPLGKCVVDYIYLENPASYGAQFEFGNGLTFNSSYEELEEYFGTQYKGTQGYYDEYTTHHETYEWVYHGEEELQSVKIQLINGGIRNVSIEKKYK